MIERWSRDQVLALAPDAPSQKAAQGVSAPGKWSLSGTTGEVLYGECKGSGAKPYLACVDLTEPAYRCSCPSRKFPCKHALGLLLLWSADGVAEREAAPQWVTEWMEGRAERAARSAARLEAARAKAAPEATETTSATGATGERGPTGAAGSDADAIGAQTGEGGAQTGTDGAWAGDGGAQIGDGGAPAGEGGAPAGDGGTPAANGRAQASDDGAEGAGVGAATSFRGARPGTEGSGAGTGGLSSGTSDSGGVGIGGVARGAVKKGAGGSGPGSGGLGSGTSDSGGVGVGGVARGAVKKGAGGGGESVRHTRVASGLAELERWLADQVRQGLAGAAEDDWDGLAKRLVDAQASGVAGIVSRLARVRAEEGWPGRLLEEYALINLFAIAYRRRAALPEPLAQTVLIRVGFPVTKEEVLAGPAVRDHWDVLGRRDEQQDRLTARRVWLRGRRTGRPALILSFAPQGQPLDASLVTGTVIDAELAYYPGAAPLRALVATRHGTVTPTGLTTTRPRTSHPGATPSTPARNGRPATSQEPLPVRPGISPDDGPVPPDISGNEAPVPYGDFPERASVRPGVSASEGPVPYGDFPEGASVRPSVSASDGPVAPGVFGNEVPVPYGTFPEGVSVRPGVSASERPVAPGFSGNEVPVPRGDFAEMPSDGPVPPGVSPEEALDEVARALAEDPWTDSWPLVLADVVPGRTSIGGLPLHRGSHDPWRLIAVSGGRPLTVAVEWTPQGVRPMSTWDDDGRVVIL